VLEASNDPEELLENTRMAIYQDRIFAFTPKGKLFQLPKGATPIDFAYTVHSDLGSMAVGAKINGRHVPLRTALANGDVVEIIKSRSASPQLAWLGFCVTGKARAAIRRAVRLKERAELASIGRKLFDEIIERLPTKVGKKATAEAVKRLGLKNEEELMAAIGTAKLDDRQVMEALVPDRRATCPNRKLAQAGAGNLDQGVDAGHGLPPCRMLSPGAGRPHRGPAQTGRRGRGPLDCLRRADRRRR
jgi:GTP pyrophosphokinase